MVVLYIVHDIVLSLSLTYTHAVAFYTTAIDGERNKQELLKAVTSKLDPNAELELEEINESQNNDSLYIYMCLKDELCKKILIFYRESLEKLKDDFPEVWRIVKDLITRPIELSKVVLVQVCSQPPKPQLEASEHHHHFLTVHILESDFSNVAECAEKICSTLRVDRRINEDRESFSNSAKHSPPPYSPGSKVQTPIPPTNGQIQQTPIAPRNANAYVNIPPEAMDALNRIAASAEKTTDLLKDLNKTGTEHKKIAEEHLEVAQDQAADVREEPEENA